MFIRIILIFLSLHFTPTRALELLNTPLPEEAQILIKENKIEFSLDDYGNLKIVLNDTDSIGQKRTTNFFSKLVPILKDKWARRGVYIHVPLSIIQPAQELESLGFRLYHLDTKNKQVVYLFRNGRNIPNMNNGYGAAGVFIVRINPTNQKKEVLILSEYDKNELTVPGGCIDNAELIVETVVRECQEEIGIKIDPKNLRLMQIKNSKIPVSDRNFFGFHFYTEVPYDTEIKIDNAEVINYKWVSIDDAKNADFVFDGKKFAAIYRVILEEQEPSSFFKFRNENTSFMMVSTF